MRIKSSDTIAGQPALTIRKFLQRNNTYASIPLNAIEEELKVNSSTAKQIFQDLCRLGYIEPTDESDEENRWCVTTKGSALAGASAQKPIKRKTAERLIQQFLEQVEGINQSKEYAFRVTKVVAFGSYVSDSPDLGDIDLAITLEPVYNDQEKQRAIDNERREKAIEAGRYFKNLFERVAWPQIEIWRILKNRSPYISLHSPEVEKEILETTPTKVLYEIHTH